MGKQIKGEFLGIVDELAIFIESKGAKPYTNRQEVEENGGVFYEIDETEGNGNLVDNNELFGWIGIYLYFAGKKSDILEFRSINSFPTSDQDNRYEYEISEETVNQKLAAALR